MAKRKKPGRSRCTRKDYYETIAEAELARARRFATATLVAHLTVHQCRYGPLHYHLGPSTAKGRIEA